MKEFPPKTLLKPYWIRHWKVEKRVYFKMIDFEINPLSIECCFLSAYALSFLNNIKNPD